MINITIISNIITMFSNIMIMTILYILYDKYTPYYITHYLLTLYYSFYLKIFYSDRDISHDFNHAYTVAKNSIYIAKQTKKSLKLKDIRIIIVSSLLHDAYDHKYVKDSSNIKKIIIPILLSLGFMSDDIILVFDIIDNISYSDELKKRENDEIPYIVFPINPTHQLLRDIVSDADKMESLGSIGVIRMIQYNNHQLNQSKIFTNEWLIKTYDHIKQHTNTKLRKLITHKYIRTEVGKQLCAQKLDELIKIVGDESQTLKYIINYS